MKFAATAVVLLALVAAKTSVALPDSGGPVPQVEDGFCSDAPSDVDARIASAVNALTVSAPTTPPIAILDTGVTGTVTEIGGRVVNPFDVTTGSSDASDVTGHGTEVAGIAAGAPGLVRGVSPTSPIMPVRVANLSGESTIQWLVAGINWAVANHAAVVNISSAMLDSDATAIDTAALTKATSDAFNSGTLVVAAAGNDGVTEPVLPADLPHVIDVGSSNLLGDRSTFSNTGPWIDLVSPAASLVAPMPAAYCSSSYGVANGTSFAPPAVAGAAALLAQLRPELSTQQRFDVLRKSAQDVGPAGRDDETGYGLLNVQNAVNMSPPSPEASREVDDDPYYVRGPNAAGHPLLLAKTRRVRVAGQISPAKDPADVYRVRLRKGDRLTASLALSGSDALAGIGFWKPTVGDFDVSNGVAKNEIVSTGGFANDPSLKMSIKKSGTYYVSVEAPDAYDPEDPTYTVPPSEPYQLTLSKSHPSTKKHSARARKRKKR